MRTTSTPTTSCSSCRTSGTSVPPIRSPDVNATTWLLRSLRSLGTTQRSGTILDSRAMSSRGSRSVPTHRSRKVSCKGSRRRGNRSSASSARTLPPRSKQLVTGSLAWHVIY